MNRETRVLRAVAALLLVFAGTAVMAAGAPPKKHDFKPGQVWTFKEEKGEPPETLTILAIDSVEKIGDVVHISVAGVHVAGHPTGIGHLPISREALDRSVLKLVRTEKVAPDLAGYERWKKSKGGVFTTSVSDALGFVRGMITNQVPAH